MRASTKCKALGKHQQSSNDISLLDDNVESHFMTGDHQSSEYLASGDASKHINVQSQADQMQFCTLESSLPTVNYTVQSVSPTSGNPVSQPDWHSDHVHGSPVSASCVTDDPNDLKSMLRGIGHEMLGAEYDTAERLKNTYPDHLPPEPEKWRQVMGIRRGDLKQHLIACARAIAEDDLIAVEWLIPELKRMVSVSGEPIQRLGAYLLEGLIAKLSASGSSIYKALECKEPASADLLSYMHILYEVCPYFKFGYLSANGAISEAIKDENMVHIIDFQIAQGSQWVTLIQALAERPGGPPHLRITGIDDPYNAHARGGGLHIVGRRLSQLADSCNVPFEFHAVPISGCDVEIEHLDIRPGEQLAVNFPMELHHIPDESVSTRNHRDRILRMAKSLSPKVVTLVEQEANTNTAPFFARFLETLEYYSAVFESIDVTLPRENKERINVEQHCLARDIVNVIACEGAERVERYELFGKWKSRLTMAGFRPFPLSSLVNATITLLIHSSSLPVLCGSDASITSPMAASIPSGGVCASSFVTTDHPLRRCHVVSVSFVSSRRAAPLPFVQAAASSKPGAAAGVRSAKGITKPRPVSPAMQALVGVPEIPRTQALKLIWAHIKEHNLQDPNDKKVIICDEKLKAIFGGRDRVGFLEIAGLITPHFAK